MSYRRTIQIEFVLIAAMVIGVATLVCVNNIWVDIAAGAVLAVSSFLFFQPIVFCGLDFLSETAESILSWFTKKQD